MEFAYHTGGNAGFISIETTSEMKGKTKWLMRRKLLYHLQNHIMVGSSDVRGKVTARNQEDGHSGRFFRLKYSADKT